MTDQPTPETDPAPPDKGAVRGRPAATCSRLVVIAAVDICGMVARFRAGTRLVATPEGDGNYTVEPASGTGPSIVDVPGSYLIPENEERR